jgi:serine/threonine protein kinase
MFAMLGAASAAIFGFSIVNARLNREARLAALDAKQLGQYTLDEKLGEGGMGVVYHGHHALLLRPTAIKFLHPEKTNDQTVARFEREVKLTSQLVHPNTIAVYDYGRTPEGIFYYAMEYLDGLNLEDLVKRYGPQSDGRTAHILRQVCGSLAEAHGIGLIHRDIKPANIMLSLRGGVPDFVKVLDFGLVKALDANQQSNLTSAGGMTGTPLYLSPEAIRTPEEVDARSDIYAIGAVGYFLLTGRPVFEGANVLEIVRQHAETPPVLPSERCGRPVNTELERVLLRCLAKRPGDRPQSAMELDELLQACCAGLWVRADALRWWQNLKTRSSAQGLASTDWDAGATIVAGR